MRLSQLLSDLNGIEIGFALCGTRRDRDINAAINIKSIALRYGNNSPYYGRIKPADLFSAGNVRSRKNNRIVGKLFHITKNIYNKLSPDPVSGNSIFRSSIIQDWGASSRAVRTHIYDSSAR
ncbi:predicted protein [Methanosarcina acetivorans C2A]|uniref:Uncharacterized protein n=1 Tax=Methanosarcina acetivorans (strain ATCC 35395 / DSM 2834 / JCM 12185 / C2A) TaxID=188937 RepID=Q8TL29_METAC|nr:predicted protein [Methanosarcina acetivorans C2A]